MPIDPATKRSDLDVLSTTDLARWRDVDFVCGPISWGFDQQHAVHTYPDRDAGYVESTGRNPATFTFTAMFRCGVVGPGGGKDAFPEDFRRFQAACADRSAGVLVHPILGSIKAKCQSVRVQIDPMRRDGADVEVSFIEATDREDELAALLAQTSALGSAYAAARSFDDGADGLQPSPPEYPESLRPSLTEALKRLSGALDQARLGLGNLSAQVDGFAQAVNNLTDRIVKADDPRNQRMIAALERLFGATVRLGQEVARKGRPVRPAVLPRSMSLAEAAAFYNVSVSDFARLNPLAALRDTLPRGTQVFVPLA